MRCELQSIRYLLTQKWKRVSRVLVPVTVKHGLTNVTFPLCARVRKILKSKLNGGNTVLSINTCVVRYTAGIVKWMKDELLPMDRHTRKMLTESRCRWTLHSNNEKRNLSASKNCATGSAELDAVCS